MNTEELTTEKPLNFIEQFIEEDLATERYNALHTRFPPEPNGYLHIGHAKAICVNFGLAQKYGGQCNLRFDDTNPSKENIEYVESIKEDVKWLGFEWANLQHSSDYFDELYSHAIKLIENGNAYVCQLKGNEISEYRGVPTSPGKPSPWRDRTIEESLTLFLKMKNGELEEGTHTLRAKIDMASPNMHMRDPVIYRIQKSHHYRTGNKWNIYPMYDFAHGTGDAIEGISHSLCTLEFEVHRPLYEWINNHIWPNKNGLPRQIEFARLNLSYTMMSKRLLLQLVEEGHVSGWDDPRMPTISGFRRRGYTPESIRNFCDKVGVAKRNNVIDVALLEHSIREDLNQSAQRRFAVLNPLKVVITNYPNGEGELLPAANNPEDEHAGNREIPFSNTLYIEQDDFMEDAPKKFFRLAPGRCVRLKFGYIIQCNEVLKDEKGNVTELHCEYFPNSKSGSDTSGIKAKGTLHWVSARHAVDAEVRLYDRLFEDEIPSTDKPLSEVLNPHSIKVLTTCKAEPSLAKATAGERFQFQRIGYFCVDSKDHTSQNLVFNRTVTLKDSWAKKNQKNG